jgi:hypothetical protein
VDIILNIKVKKHSNGYAFNQSYYIKKIRDKFKHLNIKEVNISFEYSIKLIDYCDKTIAQLEYTIVIENLMYAMHCTKLDIAFVIYKL